MLYSSRIEPPIRAKPAGTACLRAAQSHLSFRDLGILSLSKDRGVAEVGMRVLEAHPSAVGFLIEGEYEETFF